MNKETIKTIAIIILICIITTAAISYAVYDDAYRRGGNDEREIISKYQILSNRFIVWNGTDIRDVSLAWMCSQFENGT